MELYYYCIISDFGFFFASSRLRISGFTNWWKLEDITGLLMTVVAATR